jgi:hypothetical protein
MYFVMYATNNFRFSGYAFLILGIYVLDVTSRILEFLVSNLDWAQANAGLHKPGCQVARATTVILWRLMFVGPRNKTLTASWHQEF